MLLDDTYLVLRQSKDGNKTEPEPEPEPPFPRGVFGKKYQNPRCMFPHENPKENINKYLKKYIYIKIIHILEKSSFEIIPLL